MHVKTRCTHCNAEFNVQEEFLGRKATCKKCGARFTLAAVADSARSDSWTSRKACMRTEESAAPATSSIEAPPARGNATSGWIFAGLAAAAVAILGGATWWSLATRAAEDQRMRERRTQLQQMVTTTLEAVKQIAASYDFDKASSKLDDLQSEIDTRARADAITRAAHFEEIDNTRHWLHSQRNDYDRKVKEGWSLVGGRLVSPEDQRPKRATDQANNTAGAPMADNEGLRRTWTVRVLRAERVVVYAETPPPSPFPPPGPLLPTRSNDTSEPALSYAPQYPDHVLAVLHTQVTPTISTQSAAQVIDALSTIRSHCGDELLNVFSSRDYKIARLILQASDADFEKKFARMFRSQVQLFRSDLAELVLADGTKVGPALTSAPEGSGITIVGHTVKAKEVVSPHTDDTIQYVRVVGLTVAFCVLEQPMDITLVYSVPKSTFSAELHFYDAPAVHVDLGPAQ